MSRLRLLTFILILLIFIVGCTAGGNNDEKVIIRLYNKGPAGDIEKVVIEYITQLQTAMEKTNVFFLEPYTTERQLMREKLNIEMNKLSFNLKMIAVPQYIEVKEVSVHKDKATVKTVEKWWVKKVHVNSGKKLAPPEEQKYEATYSLIKQGDKWFVDNLQSNEPTKVIDQ